MVVNGQDTRLSGTMSVVSRTSRKQAANTLLHVLVRHGVQQPSADDPTSPSMHAVEHFGRPWDVAVLVKPLFLVVFAQQLRGAGAALDWCPRGHRLAQVDRCGVNNMRNQASDVQHGD